MKSVSTLAVTAIVIALSAQTAWAGMHRVHPSRLRQQVIAVDAASNRVTATYDGVDNPHGLVATPDGEYLVAGSLSETPLPQGASVDTANSKLAVIHPAHGHVMSTIPVAGWTHHQAITPDGR